MDKSKNPAILGTLLSSPSQWSNSNSYTDKHLKASDYERKLYFEELIKKKLMKKAM
jgi:hypothetical protein